MELNAFFDLDENGCVIDQLHRIQQLRLYGPRLLIQDCQGLVHQVGEDAGLQGRNCVANQGYGQSAHTDDHFFRVVRAGRFLGGSRGSTGSRAIGLRSTCRAHANAARDDQ